MSDVTTRLLTLLNVSAVKAGSKRKRDTDDTPPPSKLNKPRAVHIAEPVPTQSATQNPQELPKDAPLWNEQPLDEDVDGPTTSAYEEHYGPTPKILSDQSREAVTASRWKSSIKYVGKLSRVVQLLPEGSDDLHETKTDHVLPRLRQPFETKLKKEVDEIRQLETDLVSALGTHRDLFLTRTSPKTTAAVRESTSLHLFDHVTRKRRRVLKNNERLAHAHDDPPTDIQDQGFTRPSILVLLPFRSSALKWLNAFSTHTPSPAYQFENLVRFRQEYGLPDGAVDKLASAPAGTYPNDHVDTFEGNIDDNFRLGIKVTRKSIKLFADFYNADLVIASPLGLRMAIEKDKNADFLSSIEIVVADQLDAISMQNWDHLQFVFSNMNEIPKDVHDTDFSRIKPWYLDGHASYLRQTIMLSAYETPEMRSLFNSFKNLAGKMRTHNPWAPIDVPAGIQQNLVPFNCMSPQEEADQRFKHFTTQLLPAVMKSAVQSTNTVIFVPSSFDFIRVQNYLKKLSGMEFTVLSEYSTNQEISRARQAFFLGKKPFLLMSERFHFYRRYKIRGIRNVLFYAPPDHLQFFTELLSYSFLDDAVDASDVSYHMLYCKYDWMRLERIVGSEGVKELMTA